MNMKRRVLSDQQLAGFKGRYPLYANVITLVFDAYAEWHENPILQTELALRAAKENDTDPLDEMKREHTV